MKASKPAPKHPKNMKHVNQQLTEEDLKLLVDAIHTLATMDRIPLDITQIIRAGAHISGDDEVEIEVDFKLFDNTTLQQLYRHPLVSQVRFLMESIHCEFCKKIHWGMAGVDVFELCVSCGTGFYVSNCSFCLEV
jgi:hypothetical protein